MGENLSEAAGVVLQIAVPSELVDIGVAPDLQRFFDAMIYKLRRNSHKGRWETLALEDAMNDLGEEFRELDFVIGTGSTSEILMEAADVANEALIVAAIALEAKNAALTPASARLQTVHRSGPAKPEQPKGNGAARRFAREPAA